MPQLRVIEGTTAGQPIVLDRPSLTMGRHPDCEIIVQSGSVSRRHAQLTQRDGSYFIKDLNSRNGTFVNGNPVRDPTRLRHGDEIRICDFVAQFVHEMDPNETARSNLGSHVSAVFVDDEESHTQSSICGRLGVSSEISWQQISASASEKLQAFVELSKNLAKSLSLGDVLPPVLDSLFKIFLQAESGFIIFCQPDGSLLPVATRCRNEDDDSVRISRGIIHHVLSSREAVISADAADDSRFALTESIAQFQIRSFMCAPLVTPEGDLLGAVQIDTRDPRRVFTEKDLEIMLAVAFQVAVSIQNAQLHEQALEQRSLQRDLELAREVQRGLLPQRRPELPGYMFYDYYQPASQIGGDYFDYRELPGPLLATIVADVSGHGVPAALLMSKLAGEARSCLAQNPEPATVLSHLNQLLCDDGVEDRFVTMALIVLQPAAGQITIANAGHLAPIRRSATGALECLADAITGPPLGIAPELNYRQETFTLEPGETIILLTDGISEAMNATGEQYGFERLHAAIAAPSESITEIGERILSEVRRFVGATVQSDDMCLVEMQRVESADFDTE